MDLLFFPLLGLGLFATSLGIGLWPALFSLGMMLAYSVVMGTVYGIVYSDPNKRLSGIEWKRLGFAENASALDCDRANQLFKSV